MKPKIVVQLETEGYRTEIIRYSLTNLMSQPVDRLRDYLPAARNPAIRKLCEYLIQIDERKDEKAFNELLDFVLNEKP